MVTIKSFSVGHGDMFYINHGADSFTVIDCCLGTETKEVILQEIKGLSAAKGISRFISTHPDDDHVRGLKLFDERLPIANFYCVRNAATKTNQSDDFDYYCQLRDSSKAFYITRNCKRKWINDSSEERGSAGIEILWPKTDNRFFLEALAAAARGEVPNNISAIVQYTLKDGPTALWMGDMDTEFMENIESELSLPHVDILFAPHHGRDSGKIPSSMLEVMSPKVIIVGEAPSQHLHYYPEFNTITQNSAGNIVFGFQTGKVHVFTSNAYEVDFLVDESLTLLGHYYVGTLNLG